MLSNDILNQMNADELRNYAAHQNELLEAYSRLLKAKDEANTNLQMLYNSQNKVFDEVINVNSLLYADDTIASSITEKYAPSAVPDYIEDVD